MVIAIKTKLTTTKETTKITMIQTRTVTTITSPDRQIDASVVDSYMKPMFFSNFGPVLPELDGHTDGQTGKWTDRRTNPPTEMQGCI